MELSLSRGLKHLRPAEMIRLMVEVKRPSSFMSAMNSIHQEAFEGLRGATYRGIRDVVAIDGVCLC